MWWRGTDMNKVENFIQQLLNQVKREGYEKGQLDAMNGINPPLEQKIKRLLAQAKREGVEETLKELISVFKKRDPLDTYTTNVILLELEVRLSQLNKESK